MADQMNTPPAAVLTDTERLHQMGYAQELHRGLSRFSNFAISFTIISILSGCLTLYSYGLTHGGPPTMIWGWAIVGALVLLAGLSMAEICSAFPTAGGLYYWSAKLAPGKSGPIWSWFTGWFNLLGQVAVTAGITFGCGYSIGEFIYLVSGNSLWTDNRHVVLLTAILLLIQGLINTFGVNIVSLFNRVSVWWHLTGVAVIVLLLFIAPHSHSHQSAGFLFGSAGFDAFRGLSGFSVPFYVFLLGLLVAQYTFTGYDASAHVTEETLEASVSGPKGIVTSIWVSWIAGFILLIGVSAAIPHFVHGFSVTIAGTHYTSYASFAGGVPWGNVFVYATGKVLGESLVRCGWRIHPDDAGTPSRQHWRYRLRRRDVDRSDRTLRRVSDPGLPATDQRCRLHTWAVEAREMGSSLRLDCHCLGGHHLRLVHAPRDVADQCR